MTKIAITGSTGFVGGNLAEALLDQGFEVVGLGRASGDAGIPWQIRVVDFSSVESLTQGLVDCDAVIHCAIHNDFNKLVNDREYAYDAFVGMTQRVTKAANANGAKMIFISTDWLLDGTQHMSQESNPGNPINFYGALKMMAEQVVRDLAPDSGAICRIGGVMGLHRTKPEMPRGQDVGFGYFVASIVAALRAGKEFAVWGGDRVNKVATPSLASEIGAEIGRIVDLDAHGTFHLVGDDAVSRMELAQKVCEVFGLDANLLVESEPPVEALFPSAVPVDTSMSNAKTKSALKLGPTSIYDLLNAFKREFDGESVSPITQRL
jgi:dTDP-4-dehydrorhamnose reductase